MPTKEDITMNTKRKQTDSESLRRKRLRIVSGFTTVVLLMILFSLQSLIEDVRIDASAFEISYEANETFPQAGNTYTLYADGEYWGEIDQNRFCMIDENGQTDYKYCVLMEDASRLAYIIILCSMLLLVLLIVKDSLEKTPFTRKNIRIVKAISILQLLLGIIPGTVRTVMSQLRFGYSSDLLDEKWVYMIIIAFIIGSIAYVFEKGLDLQEDVDSIV